MLRAYTRVAVVQLAYHPAIVASRRSPLEDPLFDPSKPDSLLPDGGAVPPSIEPRLAALRKRIREAYNKQFLARAGALLATCRSLGARVAVFPESSVPWEILGGLADLAGDMVLVAGSHTVDRAAHLSGLYEQLGIPVVPEIGRVVCPVLHRGRLLALTPKLLPGSFAQITGNLANIAKPTKTSAPFSLPRWKPVPMPEGIPGPMGVLLHDELLHRDRAPLRDVVSEPLRKTRFLAVPSFAARPPDRIAALVWDEARRFGRPVLYASHASEGGTSIFTDEARLGDLRRFPDYAGYLEPNDEGAIVADVDLGLDRSSKVETPGNALIPVAEATLIYRAHPVADAYAQWLEETAPLLEGADGLGLTEAVARVEASRVILLNAGALSDGGARDRRLQRLLNEIDKVTDLEEIRQFTREIVLSSDILPLPVLRGAMARGAADAIFEWLPSADAKAAGFGEVEARLRGEADKLLADASSWARAAIEAISAVRQAVRGAQEGDLHPPVSVPVQFVLPAGVDPAALGIKKSRGFLFDFRARPEDFRDSYREADEPRSTRRGIQLLMRAKDIETVAGADLSEAHLWVADELYLLAIAEGADRVGVVAVRPEASNEPAEPSSPDVTRTFDTAVLLVLSATEGGWIAREAGRSLWLSAKWQDVKEALAGAGIAEAKLQSIPVAEYPGRILSLLDRVKGARETIEELRRRKLREVEGHFVPPDVLVNGGITRRSILEALDEWLASDEQTALVLGEFGAGKSTSLAEWTYRHWEAGSRSHAILVSLATAPRAMDAEGLLLQAARAEDTRQNRAALRLLLRRRLVIACFDGFDEMATRLEASDLAGRLSGLLEVGRGGGKVVVTSRDNYFPSEEDLKTTSESAIASTLGAPAGLRRLALQPFNEAQVQALVEKIRGEAKAAEQALAKIAQTYDLRDLVSRPLLLGMVLATLDQIEPGATVGTADLYEAYLVRWLEQTRSGDPECFTDNQKVEFAEAMADQLWRSGRATCTWQELQQSVRARLAEYLRGDMPAGAAFLEIQGGAFFVREGEDRYRFAHKSFLEYFLARAIVNTIAERTKEVLNTKPLTKEVAAFMGEILRRSGGAKEAPAVRAMRAWLVGGMADAWSDDRREMPLREHGDKERGDGLKQRATAAANAARLLLELGRWAGEPGGWIPEGADLHQVKLIGEDLRGAKLTGADLEEAHLSAADLRGADLHRASLKNAIVSGAKLDSAILSLVSAKKTDFIQAEAQGADLLGADLSGALLRQSMWADCRWEQANLAGADITAAAVLGADPPLDGELSCPVVPPAAIASLLTGVSRRIGAPSFSPDSIRVATSGKHGTARTWDARSGQELMLLAGHEKPVTVTAWSRDGLLLATASDDGSVRLWRTDTGAQVAVMRPGEKIRCIAWHPQGAQIAIASDDHVDLWSVSPPLELARFSAVDFDTSLSASKWGPICVTWSPGGDLLGAVFADLSKEPDSFRSLGAMLALWSPSERKKVASARHSDRIHGIAFHPEGLKLAGMSEHGKVVLWDVFEMRAVGHFDTNDWGLLGVDWHWRGLRVASYSRDTVHIWDAGTGQKLAAIGLQKPHEVAWSPDGARLLLTTHAGDPRVWDMESGTELARVKRSPWSFREVVWSRSAPVFATSSDDGAARLWSAETGQVLAHIEHDPAVGSVALHPDGRRLAFVERGLIRVLDMDSGAEIASLKSDTTLGARLLWHPDGIRLASEEASGLTLWDTAQGRALMRASEGQAARALGWSPTGEALFYVRGDCLHVWDIARRAEIPDVVRRAKLSECAWSVSGLRFAASRRDWIWVFDLDLTPGAAPSMRQVTTFPREGAGASELALSPTGTSIALAEGAGCVVLLDIHSKREVRCSVENEHRAIRPVAFSRDGARLAGVGSLGVFIWDTASGRLLCSFEAVHQSSIARTPGGFCVFGGGDPDAYRLALRRPPPEGRTILFLPLGSLREALHNPEKVAAALRGDLAEDDARAALEARHYAGGAPWSGDARRAPDIPITSNTLESFPPRRAPEQTAGDAPSSAPPGGVPAPAPNPPQITPAPAAPAPPASPIPPQHPSPMRQAPTAIRQRGTSIPPAGPVQHAQPAITQSPPPAPLQNPFRPGPALTDQETLPGREVVLTELLGLIDSRSPAVLRGPRRSGKTSILYTIEKRLAAAGRNVRRITLEGATIVTVDDLARVIDPSLRGDPSPGEALRAILRAEKGAVVLLDEVAHLISADPSLFAWLRAIGQEEASLVFAGSHLDWVRVVERAASAPGSSFGNDVTPVTLGPIPEADALQFLARNAPPDAPIEEERTARWIVDQCGPWPFYLQVMGHAVVAAVRTGSRLALVERRGVSDLYEQRLILDRDLVFRGRWTELPERARRVLRVTASAEVGSAINTTGLPAYKDLSRDDRKVLRDTGLCSPQGQWLDDRPFFDWIRRSADDHEGGQG